MSLTLLTGTRERTRRAKDRHKYLGDRADASGIIRPKNGPRYSWSVMGRAAVPSLIAFELLRQRYAAHVDPQVLRAAVAGVPLLLGPKQNFARTYEYLGDLLKSDANQPESQPWVLFDTQTYPQAGVSTAGGQLPFFQNSGAANNTDVTLSNFPAGALQADYYFEQHRIHSIIGAMPNTNASVAITGAAQDVEILHKTARCVVQGKYRGKEYFGFPLAYFGRPGGPVPSYAGYGTGIAANNTISAGETAENGGFPVLGNIVLAPTNNWLGWMQFVSSTAISAATPLVYSMMGVLHRPVG